VTIDQELLLRRLYIHPGEADRLRVEFEKYVRRKIRQGKVDPDCPTARQLRELVHAAISAAEDGLLFR
jgi:hypothetical protein